MFMARTLALLVLLCAVARAGPAPRVYLRRVRFEPSRWKRPFPAEPGATIDDARARELAEALRRQIVDDRYRDAKVECQVVPTGFRQADLLLKVDEGPLYRVQEVRFSGDSGFGPRELRQALRSTRDRRALAWRMHPAFSQSAVEADRARLQSFYASRGYFDARVAVGSLQFSGPNASITFAIDAGSRYRVRQIEASAEGVPLTSPGGDWPARESCRCLLDARRQAESSGHADFHARLDIAPAPSGPDGWVALAVRLDPGPVYMVGRIEFRGNHSFGDATLRRAMLLEEGGPFDRERLRRSLARLNRLGFFEPLAEGDVAVEPVPGWQRVNLTLLLRQRPRGRWSLSGPVVPFGQSVFPDFSISWRLPGWGRSALEASTYYAAFSLFGIHSPILRALPHAAAGRALPLISLERPYLPGQAWLSGFSLSPQLGRQGSLATYGLIHLDQTVRSVLLPDRLPAPPLEVPIEPAGGAATLATLTCEARPPRLGWLRSAGALAADWLLAPRPF
jgi:hypothetical protein